MQAALRSQTLDFEPFVVEFAGRMSSASSEMMEMLRNKPEGATQSPLMRDFHKAMHEGLAPGPKLDAANLAVLTRISNYINNIDDVFEPKSLYIWLRRGWTEATTTSLFGSHNPFLLDPTLCDALWYVSFLTSNRT